MSLRPGLRDSHRTTNTGKETDELVNCKQHIGHSKYQLFMVHLQLHTRFVLFRQHTILQVKKLEH